SVFFFQAEDGIRDFHVTGVQTCALPIFSQIEQHRVYGGVVPELASRDHVKRMIPLIRQVLDEADCAPNEIDAICYTAGPGLVGRSEERRVGKRVERGDGWGVRTEG